MSLSVDYQSPLQISSAPVAESRLTSVNRNATFNYYGEFCASTTHHAAKFVADNTDGVEIELNKTLQTFLDASHNECVGSPSEKSHCWFTIRITKPNDDFDVPRWHQDGLMFQSDEGREAVPRSKYALTILGPPTLFLPTEAIVFQTITEAEKKFFWWRENREKESTEEDRDEAHDAMREWLSNRFSNMSRVKVPKGKIARFSWGRDDSPVHSEPQMVVDRVFMTVLFGSETELRSMCEYRDVEFGKVDIV